MYQLAIFDLDGTLINSIQDLADAINVSLEQMHYPKHPLDAFYHFVGNGVPKLCQRALPENVPSEQVEELLRRFSAYYNTHCLDKTRPYPGILEMLETLRQQGVTLAVASNKSESFVQSIVQHLFPKETFALVIGASDSHPKKPAPDMVYYIMETCGISSAQTVYIGDSDVDILTARNAGVHSIGCAWGFRGTVELQQAGADWLVQNPEELVKYLCPRCCV